MLSESSLHVHHEALPPSRQTRIDIYARPCSSRPLDHSSSFSSSLEPQLRRDAHQQHGNHPQACHAPIEQHPSAPPPPLGHAPKHTHALRCRSHPAARALQQRRRPLHRRFVRRQLCPERRCRGTQRSGLRHQQRRQCVGFGGLRGEDGSGAGGGRGGGVGEEGGAAAGGGWDGGAVAEEPIAERGGGEARGGLEVVVGGGDGGCGWLLKLWLRGRRRVVGRQQPPGGIDRRSGLRGGKIVSGRLVEGVKAVVQAGEKGALLSEEGVLGLLARLNLGLRGRVLKPEE